MYGNHISGRCCYCSVRPFQLFALQERQGTCRISIPNTTYSRAHTHNMCVYISQLEFHPRTGDHSMRSLSPDVFFRSNGVACCAKKLMKLLLDSSRACGTYHASICHTLAMIATVIETSIAGSEAFAQKLCTSAR